MPDDAPATVRALHNSVHPLVPASTTQRIRELFAAPTFAARRDLTREETTHLVYEQLRVINAEFGPGSDLLA